jgi:hypothetical protein
MLLSSDFTTELLTLKVKYSRSRQTQWYSSCCPWHLKNYFLSHLLTAITNGIIITFKSSSYQISLRKGGMGRLGRISMLVVTSNHVACATSLTVPFIPKVCTVSTYPRPFEP